MEIRIIIKESNLKMKNESKISKSIKKKIERSKKLEEYQTHIIKWIRQTLKINEIFVGNPFVKRFLVARKFNLEKTKEAIDGYFKFRDKMLQLMPKFIKEKAKFLKCLQKSAQGFFNMTNLG